MLYTYAYVYINNYRYKDRYNYLHQVKYSLFWKVPELIPTFAYPRSPPAWDHSLHAPNTETLPDSALMPLTFLTWSSELTLNCLLSQAPDIKYLMRLNM